jgi:serine/threonine-protein kinase
MHKPKDCINDRYEIISYIGEGGMQEVFRARDLVLEREVALKVPKNSSAEKRFQRSAIVSAKVNHPNVAKTLDYFKIDSYEYLIEELIVGRDLKTVIQSEFKCIDPYLVARVFHHLAKGLAASHHAKVIHRDLKPSNVMVGAGVSLSELKITDFGIAKMAEDEISQAVEGGGETMTASKTVVGALPYMAPETIEKENFASFFSDIWSLGAMAYELLSGKKPFGEGLRAILAINEAARPQKPIWIEENLQFQAIGSSVYDVILSCLQKDPSLRPTADELVTRCESFCYSTADRKLGKFKNFHPRRNNQGFIQSEDGSNVFFYFDSVYGEKPVIGSKVSFAEFLGSPVNRAHPVVVMRDSEDI